MSESSSMAVQVGAPGTAHLRDVPSLLRVEDLVVEFPAGAGRVVHAVSDVSFDLLEGETLGLVGESGCGKSTTGRTIMQLIRATSGKVIFDGLELTSLQGEALRRVRPRLQMIFQDPISSLNPRRRVRDIVGEPLAIWGAGTSRDRQLKVREVLDAVGLDYDTASHRRPHEFSGGQCQRISVARALALEPKVLICDEPVSALDVSVQAQILNLLEDMKQRYGLTLIFIAHDLAVVKNVSDRVAVMYLGKLCELAPVDELYGVPSHPYTAGLLASIPEADPSIRPGLLPDAVTGEPPSPISPPSGCRFRTRCPKAQERCAEEEPVMREIRPNHFVACHFPLEGERWDVPVGINVSAGVNGPVGVDRLAGVGGLEAEARPVGEARPGGAQVNGDDGPVGAGEVRDETAAAQDNGADANGAGA